MLRSLRPLARRLTARRLAAILGTAVIALTLSGCVLVKNVSSSQLNTIGNVQIAATLCVSGTTGCTTPPSNTGVDPTATSGPQTVQVLVGYRVTAGATPPATLRFFDDDNLGPLFTPNASYTAELQRLVPAPAGTQWFGYSSTLLTWLFASSPTSAAIITSFGLPPAASGTPFTGPVQYQVVAGTRFIDATHSIDRPVACGSSATGFSMALGSDGQTVCTDSPVTASIGSSISQATRDIAVRPGRNNGRCVAPAPRLIARGAARCNRFVNVTTINRPGLAAGVQTVTFSGRGRVPGLYRLTATLRSAGLVSPPLSTTVTVKP